MKKKLLALAIILAIVAAMIVPMTVSAATLTVSGENGTNTAIKNAITAANPGDTITIAAGNYPEQLTITKSLTLIGAGASTVIEPTSLPASITRFLGGTLTPIISVSAATSVNIENLEVNGAGVAALNPSGFCGIVYSNASGTISGTTVTNIEFNPFSGDQAGRAILVQTNSGSSNVIIENNTVSAYQKAGIEVEDAGTNCTINRNTVTGVGATAVIAQNGIDVLYGASATVTNNTVSGNNCLLLDTEDYATSNWQDAGILLVDANPSTTVSGNTASGNDIGIWVDGTTISGTFVVSNNTLSGNLGYGIVFDSVNGTSTGNSFQSNPVGLLDTDTSANSAVTSTNDSFAANVTNSQQRDLSVPAGTFTATLTVNSPVMGIGTGSSVVTGTFVGPSASITAPSGIGFGNFVPTWNYTPLSTTPGSVTVNGSAGTAHWTVTATGYQYLTNNGTPSGTPLSNFLLIGSSTSGPWFIANGGSGNVPTPSGTPYSGALNYSGTTSSTSLNFAAAQYIAPSDASVPTGVYSDTITFTLSIMP